MDDEDDNDGDDYQNPPEAKKKLTALENCTVKVQEQAKTTIEDYDDIKSQARKEFAKRNSAASKNHIMFCLQQTYCNR